MAEALTGQAAILGFEQIQALENILSLNSMGELYLPQSLKAVKTLEYFELYISP
jgi:hypothetical protein